MYDTDLVKQILHSPEARRMRGMVTSGFYDRSRIGLWLYEVIGREYDEMADWARSIHLEAFPQTCTWSIAIWEWIYGIEPDGGLPLSYRRDRILSKKLQVPPINPDRIETILSLLTGCPVTVTENTAPYTFRVEADEGGGTVYDYRAALKTLREIKPSHLSAEYYSKMSVRFTNEEEFIFRSLKIIFAVKNRTAQLAGYGVSINGESPLDGTWLLDSYYIGLPFVDFSVKVRSRYNTDLATHWISMGLYNLRNRNSLGTRIINSVSVKNDGQLRVINTRYSGMAAQNTFGFFGTVTRNGCYSLGGTMTLNGSWSLGEYSKEDL